MATPSLSSSSSFFPSSETPPPPPINPPDPENPDPATLREQWKYAIGLYSKWYSHAWGTAILAGLSFFALGWFVKGENPLFASKRQQEQEAIDALKKEEEEEREAQKQDK